MPSNYAPSGAPMPDTIPVLQTGEVATQDNFTDAQIKKMIDGIGWCQTALGGNGATITKTLAVKWVPVSGSDLAFNDGTYDAYDDAGNSGSQMTATIELPVGATLDEFRVYVDPAGGHTWPVQFTPICTIVGLVAATGATDNFGGLQAVDPSASAAAYNVYHDILVTGLALPIDSGMTYGLLFTSEHGTNSIVGLKAYGRVTIVYHY